MSATIGNSPAASARGAWRMQRGLLGLTCLTLGAYAASIPPAASAQAARPAAAPLDTRAVVEHLAADEMEGRLTGSAGIRLAADYIIEQLAALGAGPLPGVGGFRQAFPFTAGVTDTGTTIALAADDGTPVAAPAGAGPAVRALSFSDTGTARGPLVFAGYGLSVPETDGFSYDSYATLDVSGKIVVVLRYFPEDTDGELRAALARYQGLRYKALAARERGARGVIVVTGPRSPNAGALVPLSFDAAVSDSGIVAVTVDGGLGAAIVESADRSLAEVQASFDTGNPHVAGFDLPLEAVIDVRLDRVERTAHNVLGYLPPTGGAAVDEPYVMLGAHHDHLGRGRGGDSLARAGEEGQIHNGADDNASGVAAVLAAAARLAPQARDRGVILAFWSGEEYGLLGSAAFVRQAPVPMDQIAAYLNFDMVGRLRDTLSVQAVGSSPVWTGLVEEANAPLGLPLSFVADPYLPTDVRSLNEAEVPSVAFFTGSHEDYHRPTDDAHTLYYEGLDRIAELAAAVAARLVNRPDAPEFVRAEPQLRPAGAMRIFTGTIPDYTSDAAGLLLSGVVAGGPAETAGLRGGDLVTGLAGQSIANVYDYTYALDLLKPGEPVEVVFLRGGDRMTAQLVPAARE